MITIKAPRSCERELIYTLDYVFKTKLGKDYELVFHEDETINIIFNEEQVLLFENNFFNFAHKNWRQPISLPMEELKFWQSKYTGTLIPNVFGSNKKGEAYYGIDIFGTIFYFISRYEEYVHLNRDTHGRYPIENDYLYSHNLHKLPVVDVYIEFFIQVLNDNFNLSLINRAGFKINFTCDVDHPYDVCGLSFKGTFRGLAQSLIRYKSIKLFLQRALNYIFLKFKCNNFDPYIKGIELLASSLTKKKMTGRFYFIPLNSNKRFDSQICYAEKSVKKIVKDLDKNGHSIGLHPGYDSMDKGVSKTIMQFENVNYENNVSTVLDCRYHYLRFDLEKNISDIGLMKSDSSIGYSSTMGFRAGTGNPYKMYDLLKRKEMTTTEIPLVFMDTSYLTENYENILEELKAVLGNAQKYNSEVTVLFHNNNMLSKKVNRIFKHLLEYEVHYV